MKVDLDDSDRSRLFDLLLDYHAGVVSGDITGYGQTKEDELDEVAELLAKLKD